MVRFVMKKDPSLFLYLYVLMGFRNGLWSRCWWWLAWIPFTGPVHPKFGYAGFVAYTSYVYPTLAVSALPDRSPLAWR